MVYGDTISRKEAIAAIDEQIAQCNKALKSFGISMKDEYAVKVERASLVAFREILEYLPPAQPEPCEDAVSRKAVIDMMDEWKEACADSGHKETASDIMLIRKDFIELPPVTPKQPEGVMPVKCRECVYRIKMKYSSKFDCKKGHGVNWTEFYCADGRKERDD